MRRHLLAVSKSRSSRLKKNQKAQALIEYVLLLAISAGIAVGLSGTFNNFIRKGIRKFNAVLESELRTGEFNENVRSWEN